MKRTTRNSQWKTMFWGLCILGLAWGQLTGCALFQNQMKVPSELKDSRVLSIEKQHWKGLTFKKLAMGPFHAEAIERSWKGRKKGQWKSSQNIVHQHTFTFDLVGADEKRWLVDCGMQGYRALIATDRLFSLHRKHLKGRLACVFRAGEHTGNWTLTVDIQGTQKAPQGELRHGDLRIDIKGQQNLKKEQYKVLRLLGYHFAHKNKVVSTLDITNNGALRIKQTVKPNVKTAMAGASAALVVFGELYQSM
jgi:hypothetical protein